MRRFPMYFVLEFFVLSISKRIFEFSSTELLKIFDLKFDDFNFSNIKFSSSLTFLNWMFKLFPTIFDVLI